MKISTSPFKSANLLRKILSLLNHESHLRCAPYHAEVIYIDAGRGRTLVSIGSRRVDKSVIVKFLIGSNKHSKNLIVSIGLIRTDSDYGRPTVRRPRLFEFGLESVF